eukprot:s194_g40.t1
MTWADLVSKSMRKATLHGIMMGKSLRTFKPPRNTTGTLIVWIQGGNNYAVQEHKTANHLKAKKFSAYVKEEICILYFYYYNESVEEPTSADPELEFLRAWYHESNRSKLIWFDYADGWKNDYDLMISTSPQDLFFSNIENENEQHCQTARIYKVDEATSNIDEDGITADIWDKVEAANKAELQQFVDEKAFKKIHRSQITNEMVVIDARWVRKLLVSQAACDQERTLESFDVAGAFLKGFTFAQIQRALKEHGISAPNRTESRPAHLGEPGMYKCFVQRFGKVTRQQLPFTHCGCDYEKVANGYKISQQDCAKKLKPAPVPQRDDEEKLTKEEVSDLRPTLCTRRSFGWSADDYFHGETFDLETVFEDSGRLDVQRHDGIFHVLHASGGKAKRVSYSTSHAETLSMVNGLEASTLIMIRLSELGHPERAPTLKQLIYIQENGNPIDFYGDCKDLWELVTGMRTLPQDKGQRLYVLGVKEARIRGKIRQIVLVPTECMIRDALTKPFIHGSLQLMTSGAASFYNMPNHPVLSRVLPTLADYDEHGIIMTDDEVLDKIEKAENKNVKVSHASILLGLVAFGSYSTKALLAATMVQAAAAYDQE